jgi:hypothetical protein
MPLANYTNLDFDQVKTTLKDYLKSNSNFTDYDFEGSNLSTILDVLAYNTYISSYNANMVANEVFIDTATLRENIVALARNIGYVPRSRQSSRATVSFFVDTSNISPTPATITLHKGIVATTTGSFGNQSKTFCILDDISVPVFNNIASFNDISIYEGTLLSSNFTYSTRIPNQKFILPNSGVDTSLISVTVKNNENSSALTKYSNQDSLFDIGGESKAYFLQEISDERYEIFFGDNIFGKALEEGNYITANYIVSDGDSGNGISSFQFSGRLTYTRNAQTYTVTSGISLLTTGLTSSGGDTIESVESIRRYAPRIYAAQNRALTAGDYETLIPSKIYPETESISVFGGEELIPPQYGKVFISIKPRTGDFLPNLIKQNIKSKLKKFAVAGIVPEILDLKYLYIEVDSKVYFNTNKAQSPAFVSSTVQTNTNKYAESTELNKYGARFKYSKFLKIVDDSHEAITSNITTLRMRRDLRVVLNGFAEYQIGFGNKFQVKDPDGFNIKTSAFKIDGISQDVYLGDLPRPNRETGTLFFFTLPNVGSQSPSIVRRNVGSIDYINGVITINPVNIQGGMVKDGQTIIEIEATPSSNDVIGLQDLYLQLDISNSNFETVVDEISSGLDPAGSNYIVTSSYPNGNLVREGGRGSIVRTSTSTTTSARPTTTTTTTSVPSTTVSTSGSSTGGSGSGGGSGY